MKNRKKKKKYRTKLELCKYGADDYLSQHCNSEFLKCVDAFRRSGAPSFKGNTCQVDEVVKAIDHAIRAAVLAGKVFGKP